MQGVNVCKLIANVNTMIMPDVDANDTPVDQRCITFPGTWRADKNKNYFQVAMVHTFCSISKAK